MGIPWERLLDPQTVEAGLAALAWAAGVLSVPLGKGSLALARGLLAVLRRRQEARRQRRLESLAADLAGVHQSRLKAAVAAGYAPTCCDDCGQMTVRPPINVKSGCPRLGKCETCGSVWELRT